MTAKNDRIEPQPHNDWFGVVDMNAYLNICGLSYFDDI